MPFIQSDVSRVRRYLGYQATSDHHAFINARLNEIQTVSENEVSIAQQIIRELDQIMNQLGNAKNPNELRSHGKRLVNELSFQIGIAIREDIFAVNHNRIVRG